MLEEYGIVGFMFFLGGFWAVFRLLLRARARLLDPPLGEARETSWYWTILAGLLAAVAMAFHSIGDFNLQVPATTWMLAALLAIPAAHAARGRGTGAAGHGAGER